MENRKRDQGLDCMKGLLVWGMILAHCLQFFGREELFPQNYIVNFVNLHAFSGFFMAFGYASGAAYYQKDKKTVMIKMAAGAGKVLLAFYLSGICFYALAEKKLFRTDLILEVLLIKRYPGWSEFLVAFGAVQLLGILCFGFFQKMNTRRLMIAGVVSAVSCLVPADLIKVPQLAMIFGSAHFITFPVLPYFVCYSLGVWMNREQEREKGRWNALTIVTAVLSLPALVPFFLRAELPGRFPPVMAYPFGGLFLLVCLYRICRKLSSLSAERGYRWFVRYLSGVGENSLFYLIVSNIIIFAFSSSPFSYRHLNYALFFDLVLMAVLYYLSGLAGGKQKKMIILKKGKEIEDETV